MCLTPDTPNLSAVGSDYSMLLNQFAGGVPTQLNTESAYKPGFINTALSGTNQTLFGGKDTTGLLGQYQGTLAPLAGAQTFANRISTSGNVGTVAELGPGAARAVGDINPDQAALTKELTSTAATGLAAGSRLDPNDVSNITRAVRGDWASRGLGDAAPAQLNEAVNLETAGQQELVSREQQAQSAIGVNQNNITLPALGLTTAQSGATSQGQSLLAGAGQFEGQAGASLVPTNELADALNTVYNARAAANIAGANNTAALASSALSY